MGNCMNGEQQQDSQETSDRQILSGTDQVHFMLFFLAFDVTQENRWTKDLIKPTVFMFHKWLSGFVIFSQI